jgi:hypothetical protein
MAVRAKGDQLTRFLAAGAAVVDVGARRERAAGGTAVAVAGEHGQAEAAEAAAGVSALLAAAAAEVGLGGRGFAAGAEEGFLEGKGMFTS